MIGSNNVRKNLRVLIHAASRQFLLKFVQNKKNQILKVVLAPNINFMASIF